MTEETVYDGIYYIGARKGKHIVSFIGDTEFEGSEKEFDTRKQAEDWRKEAHPKYKLVKSYEIGDAVVERKEAKHLMRSAMMDAKTPKIEEKPYSVRINDENVAKYATNVYAMSSLRRDLLGEYKVMVGDREIVYFDWDTHVDYHFDDPEAPATFDVYLRGEDGWIEDNPTPLPIDTPIAIAGEQTYAEHFDSDRNMYFRVDSGGTGGRIRAFSNREEVYIELGTYMLTDSGLADFDAKVEYVRAKLVALVNRAKLALDTKPEEE